jgi:hypothetical protein
MAITIRSLDDVDILMQEGPESMKHRDLASKLRKFGSLVISKIHRDALVSVSQWLTYLHKSPWELGLVQDRFTKALRLVNGEATTSFRLGAKIGEKYLRPNDIFIVHVHPVVASKPTHVDVDRTSAGDAIEGVLDWSGKLLCYTRAKLYNEPDRGSPVTSLRSAEDSIRRGSIPFLDSQGFVTGYRHFDDETHEPKFINPFDPFH